MDCSGERMAKNNSPDDDKAQPRGDTGDGDTGVPADEQGISNRPGDTDLSDAAGEFDDDEDEDDDETEEDDEVEDDEGGDTGMDG
jgi:hypothetical protein